MNPKLRVDSIEHWSKSRQIRKRIIVECELVLLSPASFGNGDQEGITDMALLRDPLDGSALLTGTSIAGAIRNYLWEVEMGFGIGVDRKQSSHRASRAAQLFGGLRGDPDGLQSMLIVDDALGSIPQTELRDGVGIDPKTRTADEDMKYDYELLRAGTTFPLRFELLISDSDQDNKPINEANIRQSLATALAGLSQPGAICLGVRKRRGFGECRVATWTVTEYDLATAQGLIAWLNQSGERKHGEKIELLLKCNDMPLSVDQRQWFELDANFALESSLLIRSGIGAQEEGPDAMHIHRLDTADIRTPVLPGTSVAGALRARMLRIAQTIHGEKGGKLVENLFGSATKESYTGSNIVVRETEIDPSKVRHLVQNRIRIDRFTGGVLDNLLFDEAPLFADSTPIVQIKVQVRKSSSLPYGAAIGLLLLALKDLWTADLPLGGGANIGRGRLQGICATLTEQCKSSEQNKDVEEGKATVRSWTLSQSWDGKQRGSLQLTGTYTPASEIRTSLEQFVKEFHAYQPPAEKRSDV